MRLNPRTHRTAFVWFACVVALLGASLVACTTPTVAPTPEPTIVTTPTIIVDPTTAAPNIPITLDGAGFISGAKVNVRIDPAGGGSTSVMLAEVAPNAVGVFKLIFIMPALWSDGSPINNGDMVITASSIDGSATASVPISFQSDASAANAQPPATAATEPPAGTSTTAPPQAPTQTPVSAQPTLVLEPASGGAGLEMRVTGSGFPANLPLVVKIGTPGVGAGERVYANGTTDAQGNISLTFIMPATWPDGRAITEPSLVVLLSTEDGATRALTDFGYVAAAQPTATPLAPTPAPTPPVALDLGAVSTPDPIQAAVDFFYALIQDPAGTSAAAYFNDNLQAEVGAGKSVLAVLNLPSLFNRFEVSTASADETSTGILANLTYLDGSVVQRTLTLVKVGENWRIDSVQ